MKLAIVIPWFGRNVKGGAEQHAWQVASRLAQRGHEIDVLTTTCHSHQDDWSTNHLEAGSVKEKEGFTIRRFRVDDRDRVSFDRVCGKLLSIPTSSLKPGVSPVGKEESAIFTKELIKSKDLLGFLEQERESYDSFIFLPYLYGPILDGIKITGARAALLPCLHDEAYAYLPEVAEAFNTATSILFNSEGEQELAWRLFGPGICLKSHLVGGGIEMPSLEVNGKNGVEPKAERQGQNGSQSNGRYVLYLGRKDAGKNVPLLINAFRRFRAARPNSNLRLLLAGNGTCDLERGEKEAARDLGVVTEEEKSALLHGCLALVQPSQNESLSRVMLEAWQHGKPVGAHRSCLATAIAVERSGGGWLADSEDEWAKLFVEIDRLPSPELRELGEKGRDYSERLADWNKVIPRYEKALNLTGAPAVTTITSRQGRQRINQFLPNLSYGDAISNEAIWLRDQLRSFGHESEIFVRYIDPVVAHECQVFSPEVLRQTDAAIYHHSVGSELTPHLLRFDRPKCLIYHNITPAEFFDPFRPEYAPILRRGREDLGKLAADFAISCGDSPYNARELESRGFRNPQVLPIPVDPQKWSGAPDPVLMESLQDGRTNIVFVGRVAPNKKQDDLIGAFNHYLNLDPGARLILVGKAEDEDPYANHLRGLIASLDLHDSVTFTGNINDAQLGAYYRTAHLFWSMSEHEGFCVPLVEAMWFDVPVLAYKSSAVPETLGSAGLLFNDKTQPDQLSALAHILVHDLDLRRKIQHAQRRQRSSFLPNKVRPVLASLIEQLRRK